MDRPVIYSTEQGRSADFLFGMRAAMIGVAKLSEAILGTSTVVSGLPVTPTSPAGLTVNVGPGQIYSLASVDATAYGALAADTTDQVVKQGLLMATQNLSCPAPGTTGYSINYLIQATYQDQDLNNVVLPYYNSANPSQPLSGQSNSGAAQPTERHGVCVVAVKAGAAATTGTQTTPTPDAGYTGIAVVTVANGQTTITSSSISAYSGSPLLPTSGALHWNVQTVTATGTLGAFVTNTLTKINSASATTQTLPPANTVPAGTVAEFFNINTGVGTVARNGTDTIQLNASTGTSVALGAGDSLRLLCDGVSSWMAIGGSGQLGSAAVFGASKVGNGYQKLPSGIIIQWGSISGISGGASGAVTFPIAFPNACLWAGANTLASGNSTSAVVGAISGTPTTTGMTVANWSGSTPNAFGWLAIGN